MRSDVGCDVDLCQKDFIEGSANGKYRDDIWGYDEHIQG